MSERREVKLFAAEMEKKLRKHDSSKGPKGWMQCSVSYLLHKLKTSVIELEQEITHGNTPTKISADAADVGNFAMMVSDLAGTLSHAKQGKGKKGGVEDCERRCVVIGGENYYLIVGKNFVDATVPYENRDDNGKLRMIVDTLCNEITKALGGEIPEEENEDKNDNAA